MHTQTEHPIAPRKIPWRILLWGAAVAMLLTPLAAMQFSDAVRWDETDFIVFGIMLALAGGSCELAVRISRDSPTARRQPLQSSQAF